ncbi:hypothetical protein [Gimesia sp.]|uniref:hypothetical protein n=1 Tax=Gimesia sp. TaxID=2024833 RepID=UPI003A946323
MALNRKNSRRIMIEEEAFRYKVSTTRPDEDGKFQLNVTIQRDAGGSRLEVRGLFTRNFWLDISEPGVKTSKDYPVITPRHIRTIIDEAKAAGWQPQKTGPGFVIELENESLFSP